MNDIVWLSKKIKLSKLKDFHKNPRQISKSDFERLVRDIKQDGYHSRVKVATNDVIIGGHQRKKALLQAGYKENDEIEVLYPNRPLTEEEFERLNIRDNLSFGEFDFDILANEFDQEQLIEWGMPEEWFPEVTHVEGLTDEDDCPSLSEHVVTEPGDIWILGNHRLMCGDSTSIDAIDKLMAGAKVDMVFTDPPYGINVVKESKVGADFGVATKGKYHPIIGDNTTNTASDSYNLCEGLKIKKLIFWGGNYYADKLPASSCWLIWDKREDTGIENTFADCEIAWTNLTSQSRIYRQLWIGMIRKGEHEKRVHPTQKPIALAEWCFEKFAKEDKAILDLFGGSGSTLIACEKTNRNCFMMELDPKYCDVIIKRWQDFTGKKAILESDGSTFDDLATKRKLS